jgi:hypothetical protein
MSKKCFFLLLFVLVSCNPINLDIYEELYTIANSIQHGFNRFESDEYFLVEVNGETTIEENIRTISISYQNEMNKKYSYPILSDDLLFENQGELDILIYIDFLNDMKFKTISKNIKRSAVRIFPVFYYENNASCLLLIGNYNTKYFGMENNLIMVFAQKNNKFIMYRKMFNSSIPILFRENQEKIKNILENCFK